MFQKARHNRALIHFGATPTMFRIGPQIALEIALPTAGTRIRADQTGSMWFVGICDEPSTSNSINHFVGRGVCADQCVVTIDGAAIPIS